jgi:uncharacterized protein YigE (DUF2233 family)
LQYRDAHRRTQPDTELLQKAERHLLCRRRRSRHSRDLAQKPKANFATQSGPMLVIDGAIHPAFIVNSTDRKPRNGVGVSSQTTIYFVITKGWVSFYEFARFFRDDLRCNNALFLDGGEAPGLYAPELGRNEPLRTAAMGQ